jgi:hypothetical protein
MTVYKLTDRGYSRIWRRNKFYTEKQILLVARHQGCQVEKLKLGIRVKRGDKVVADFKEVIQTEGHVENQHNEKLRLYAALHDRASLRIIPSSVSGTAVARAGRSGGAHG